MQRVALLAKEIPSAITLARQRLQENPRDPVSINALAQAQALGGDLAGARKTLDQGLQANPKDYTLLLNSAAASAQAAWSVGDRRSRSSRVVLVWAAGLTGMRCAPEG